MPVVKYESIDFSPVLMDGVKNTTKANVIGAAEGWEDHTLRVFRVGPGGYTPRHRHDWEHVNYIIKGKGKLLVGDEVRELGEGDFAFVPPNSEHQFENASDGDFEFICIVPNVGAY